MNSKTIYHERQIRELCCLHTLNNLFQNKSAFTKKDLDKICIRLSPKNLINPHKSFLGLGDYDINVVMAALEEKNYETIWFDKRKNITILNLNKIFGFILNIPVQNRHFLNPLNYIPFLNDKKHWVAIRKIENDYYNLDSKYDRPLLIGDETKFLDYLNAKKSDQNCQILIVVEKKISNNKSYLRNI